MCSAFPLGMIIRANDGSLDQSDYCPFANQGLSRPDWLSMVLWCDGSKPKCQASIDAHHDAFTVYHYIYTLMHVTSYARVVTDEKKKIAVLHAARRHDASIRALLGVVVHPQQDVALHQCPPWLSASCCHPPGGSLPSSRWFPAPPPPGGSLPSSRWFPALLQVVPCPPPGGSLPSLLQVVPCPPSSRWFSALLQVVPCPPSSRWFPALPPPGGSLPSSRWFPALLQVIPCPPSSRWFPALPPPGGSLPSLQVVPCPPSSRWFPVLPPPGGSLPSCRWFPALPPPGGSLPSLVQVVPCPPSSRWFPALPPPGGSLPSFRLKIRGWIPVCGGIFPGRVIPVT